MSGVRNKGGAPRFYDTKMSAAHFVGEITKLLTEYGSGSFMVENREGEPCAIAYQLDGLAYRIRPDVDAMGERLTRGRKGRASADAYQLNGLMYRIRPDVDAMAERLERSNRKGKATADAVAWAQARHLLELQLEAIETGAARASEVLGGYVLTSGGRTVGEMIEERSEELMPGERLLLPGPS